MDIDIAIKEKINSLSMRIKHLCEEMVRNDFRDAGIAFQLSEYRINLETAISEIESLDNTDDIMHRLRSAIKNLDRLVCWMKYQQYEYGGLNDKYKSIYVDGKKLMKLLTASVNTLNK